jgi:hypothetical protein
VSKVQERGDAILEFQGERRQSRLCICPKEKNQCHKWHMGSHLSYAKKVEE